MKNNPRYRGLRPNPQTLGVTPLSEGEVSKPVRVRAGAEVHQWLSGLGAARLGELLTAAYLQSRGETQQTVPAATRRAAPKEAPQVVRRLVPGLYLPTKPHHQTLVEELSQGATLTQQGEAFKLERADGTQRPVDKRTAQHLLDTGVLVVAEDGTQGRASTSQTPAARKRETSRAPGRRRD